MPAQAGLTAQGGFKPVILGDSSGIQIGQTVVAIGNALGQFNNTVSVGIVSGLGRTISASDQGNSFSETLEGIIQTDAAINSGNSGGPLVNLKGEVIGINTAMAQGAQSIGFAIPSDRAKRGLYQVQQLGKIVYPFLGVEYVLVTDQIQKEENLQVDYGALVKTVPDGFAAAKAGLKTDDIVLEFDAKKITPQNSLAKILQQYNEVSSRPAYSPGDTVTLKVLRNDQELVLTAVLGEREE